MAGRRPHTAAPITAAPITNKRQLCHWPRRVAIVPFGKNMKYGRAPALMTDGLDRQFEVEDPMCLMEWASRQSPALTYACWDLLSWMPFNPAAGLGGSDGQHGLTGDDCWSTVYCYKVFEQLMYGICSHPCDLVLSKV